MRTAVIVQARMSSTRLPGKVLKPILGHPMLEHLLWRLNEVKNADDIIVATTVNKCDDPILDLCRREYVETFRGSEDNVLNRYYEAARKYKVDVIVRITSDCPLIDPQVVEQMIDRFTDSHAQVDYLSNTLKRTYPRGLDTEVFSFNALEQAWQKARKNYEKEHVTPYIREHPEKFKILGFENSVDYSHYRWTVDTVEDFELITKIYEALFPEKKFFLYGDVLELLKKYPKLVDINKNIKQKQLDD